MSDATRRSIDEEQQFIADQAHRRAMALVTEHRTLLEALAFQLLEREVLERDDFERLVKGYLADQATGGKSLPPAREPGAARLAASEATDPLRD